MKLSWLFVIVLLILVAVFSVQNAEPIAVRFVAWQVSMSAALVIQLAALLGAVVGLAVGALSRPRQTKVRPATDVAAIPAAKGHQPDVSRTP
ncbi:MAG TPA: LapA family protein [Opitutaceae bacterium]